VKAERNDLRQSLFRTRFFYGYPFTLSAASENSGSEDHTATSNMPADNLFIRS